MEAFTPAQLAILRERDKVVFSYLGTLHECIAEFSIQLGAVRNLLATKRLITGGELELAVQETRAAVMVNAALSPGIQAAEEELRRLLEGNTEKEG